MIQSSVTAYNCIQTCYTFLESRNLSVAYFDRSVGNTLFRAADIAASLFLAFPLSLASPLPLQYDYFAFCGITLGVEFLLGKAAGSLYTPPDINTLIGEATLPEGTSVSWATPANKYQAQLTVVAKAIAEVASICLFGFSYLHAASLTFLALTLMQNYASQWIKCTRTNISSTVSSCSMLIPYMPKPSNGDEECVICFAEGDQHTFCNRHAYYLGCMISHIATQMERMLDSGTIHTYSYTNGSHRYSLTLKSSQQPNCPTCRGKPPTFTEVSVRDVNAQICFESDTPTTVEKWSNWLFRQFV